MKIIKIRIIFFPKKKKLPDTIEDIEDNPELSRLLLKNPDKMTEEEKVYIASFNDREFNLFVKYLKLKDREIKWQGNGLGSGHYYKEFISIYRKYGNNANERFAKLQNFLKINYNNVKSKEIASERKREKLFKEENFSGDNMGNVEEQYNFEKKNDELMKQFEEYKNIFSEQKNLMELKIGEIERNNVDNVLKRQKEELSNEINKLKELKKKDYYLEELYQKYINDYELNKDENIINEFSLGKKIKIYLNNTGLSVDELSHRFIELNLPDNLKLKEGNFIFIPDAEKKFVALEILDEEESKQLCQILLNYSDEYIREDVFAHFIQGLIDDLSKKNKISKKSRNKSEKKEKKVFFYDEKTESIEVPHNQENSELDEESESYDNQPKLKVDDKKIDYKEKLRQKIRGKYYSEYENILKDKSSTTINRIFKGYLVRKKIKIKRIYTMIMVKRITRLFRKNYLERMKIKNEAAKKITYLIKKNYWSKKDLKSMAHFSSRWMKDNKNLTSLDKKNIAATLIQTTWKRHRLLIEQEIREYKNKISNEMLKSKICFICKKNKVYYLCKDCDNNHYCEECFRLYHSKGNKRNHNYITVNELGKDNEIKKINPEFIDKREMIKKYLNEHHLNLYQCLSMWDFKKNNTITFLNLKDALKVGGFGIDKNIQEAILDYSLRYVINGNRVLNHNKYIISLKFCTDFF